VPLLARCTTSIFSASSTARQGGGELARGSWAEGRYNRHVPMCEPV
jgi:hypothetical protein